MTHKYGAKPVVVDGIRFASTAEARRYGELKLLDQAGEIAFLALQPTYALHSVNLQTGEIVEVAKYRPDFTYTDLRTDRVVIEDVKGYKTPVYEIKKKLVEAEYGVTVQEIRYR